MRKLWGGVFEGSSARVADQFGQSIDSDLEFWQEDIVASIAHARMLGKTGILSKEESASIIKGLRTIHDLGPDCLPTDVEDIHTAIETKLKELIGDVALKLHTGRSRNDQVATDSRIYFHNAILPILDSIKALQREILDQAASHSQDLMPGYTHGQHAQPITLGYWLLAHFWPLQRDGWRLEKTAGLANYSPLGSAAFAGTSLPIDRFQTSRELGFTAPIPSALDAVSDRSWLLDALNGLSQTMIDLSRISQELILFSSHEFGFVRLGDEATTGSSIMPQKRNPDFAELIRGRTARAIANWTQVATTMKGLVLGYNRDTQDDKPPLFESVKLVEDSLKLVLLMLSSADWNTAKMRQSLERDFSTATDLADAMAMSGVPFRQAHEAVGHLVRELTARNLGLEDLDEALLHELAPEIPVSVLSRVSPEASVASRESYGGPGAKAFQDQHSHGEQLFRIANFIQPI